MSVRTIPPVPTGVPRPLWSVMIPTYENGEYLRETLRSVLIQDPGPDRMQIMVVDDCSPGGEAARVVQEVGGKRVEFFRQPGNQGHIGNFETCLLLARGHLVHLLHGDDRVRPEFYRTMEAPFLARPEIGAAFCRYVMIDGSSRPFWTSWLEQPEPGVLHGWIDRIGAQQRIQAPAMVVRRSTYERLGGFDRRVRAVGEDWEMWVRIAANFPVWYEPEPLAEYRSHGRSLSGFAARTGLDVRDVRRVIEINRTRLPAGEARRIEARARAWCAHLALDTARRALLGGEMETVRAQVREALATSRSPRVVARALLMAIRLAGRGFALRNPRGRMRNGTLASAAGSRTNAGDRRSRIQPASEGKE